MGLIFSFFLLGESVEGRTGGLGCWEGGGMVVGGGMRGSLQPT